VPLCNRSSQMQVTMAVITDTGVTSLPMVLEVARIRYACATLRSYVPLRPLRASPGGRILL
jgi:hypothetical protein